jgi:shikimate dehydrogenase
MIKLGLIGYPVSHSLSPQIQNAALQACGLEGDYSLFPIRPDDKQGLKDLLDRVRSGEITGLNVTIPHKQNVIPLLDELTPTAKAIGAVNVIYLRDSKLIGDNTDASGFMNDLTKFMADSPSPVLGERLGVRKKSALVLGAGGSARSVVYALHTAGWDVAIIARRIEQAKQLASQFEGVKAGELNFQTFQTFKGLRITLSNFQLVVNTTPLGMTPHVNQSPLPKNVSLSKKSMIYDLIYNPRVTKLVRNARAQGLHATTGLGMLIEQAALGFQLWTGHSPALDILWCAVEN